MTIAPQRRPSLRQSLQQFAATAMALIVGSQFAPTHASAFTVNPEFDDFGVDTSAGSVTATMPRGKDCIAGKPYTFRKKHASNTMTVAFTGGELYEGASTIAVTDDNAVISIMWDPVALEWVRATPAGAGGAVPTGALAKANNLNDLASAPTALTNLGGTTVGKAVFTAVDAAAARTAMAVPATTAVDLKSDTHSFGPFDLSLVAADADKIRFRPGFACVITGVVAIQTKGTVATGTAIATLTTTAGSPTSNTVTHSVTDAANQVRTATPAGANCIVGATDFVDLAITGTNDGAGTKAAYTIQYTRS